MTIKTKHLLPLFLILAISESHPSNYTHSAGTTRVRESRPNRTQQPRVEMACVALDNTAQLIIYRPPQDTPYFRDFTLSFKGQTVMRGMFLTRNSVISGDPGAIGFFDDLGDNDRACAAMTNGIEGRGSIILRLRENCLQFGRTTSDPQHKIAALAELVAPHDAHAAVWLTKFEEILRTGFDNIFNDEQ
jgi:hypothetical protein